MRRLALAALLLGGCVELGLIEDGTTVSLGTPSGGSIKHGKKLPDSGVGFTTRDQWKDRGNRYGTDELIELITNVSKRLAQKSTMPLVVADLSKRGGGAALKWHRSHQSGRDVDLLYYMLGPDGQPIEAEKMIVFKPDGTARDGSGISVDIPRTWQLVKELITAPEATVQWVFMYQPIAEKLFAYAASIGEPESLIARARIAAKQPGDSAPHHDHMHVRVYCAPTDRMYGCVDIGPREMLALREAELDAAVAGALLKPPATASAAAIAAPASEPATDASPAPLAEAPAAVEPPPSTLEETFHRIVGTNLLRWRP